MQVIEGSTSFPGHSVFLRELGCSVEYQQNWTILALILMEQSEKNKFKKDWH